VIVVFGGDEDASKRNADVLRDQAFGEFEDIDGERQFNPQHKASFRAACAVSDFAIYIVFDN